MRLHHVAANALSILIVLGIAGLVALGWARNEMREPGPLQQEAIVEIPRGASLKDISRLLALNGVIDNETLFRLGARYSGRSQDLKFGEYAFAPGISMEEAIDKMARGDILQRFVTIPEGKTSWEAVQILKDNPLLTGDVEVPPEGSLFPDTYDIQRNQPRAEVIARMQKAMEEKLAAAWEERAKGLPIETPEEALVLASIVEKETGIASERPEVAAVFVNRLKKGMKLQSDPTVVYGVTGGEGPLGRGLKRSELEAKNDYNTYVIEGLPPKPIANPGLDAIKAVLNPADSDFLYFVADGSGGHVFSRTLEEHNRNVKAWRKIEAERAAERAAETEEPKE